ncbi:6-phosphofructokinase [Aureococcus anophagefferens]|nr:6-phosphofructokinase [Aureococcus anophagefferens]
MRILYALVAATAFAFAPAAPPRTAVAPGATRRGRDGKIYVGEPEPIEQVGDLLRNLGRGLEQGARGVMDDVFGKQPVLNPIPIEMPRGRGDAEKDPSTSRRRADHTAATGAWTGSRAAAPPPTLYTFAADRGGPRGSGAARSARVPRWS